MLLAGLALDRLELADLHALGAAVALLGDRGVRPCLGAVDERFRGALVVADAAGRALLVVHHRQIALHGDRAFVRADLDAQGAGDTADRAYILDRLALVQGFARQVDELRPRDELEDLPRTLLNAYAASRAFRRVDDRQSVRTHLDRLERADRHAVAAAQAAVGARLVAAQEHVIAAAIARSDIVVALDGFVAAAAAPEHADPGLGLGDFDTQDLADLPGGLGAADRAKIRRIVAGLLGQGPGVRVTARKTARPAVGAGQDIPDHAFFRAHAHGQSPEGNGQDESEGEA